MANNGTVIPRENRTLGPVHDLERHLPLRMVADLLKRFT